MSVFEWLGKVATSALDPDRELRVQQLETYVTQQLRALGANFNLRNIQLGSDYSKMDLRDALELIYSKALSQAWADNLVTQKERNYIRFLEQKFELEKGFVESLKFAHAKEAFGSVLSDSLSDRILDAREVKHLTHIASQVGHSLPSYAGLFFKDECEDFVEHVLADVKADECITTNEEKRLVWVLENLGISAEFKSYAFHEMERIKWMHHIQNGVLPTLDPPPGVETVGGELVHSCCPCNYCQVRNLKSGPQTRVHSGTLVITDRKILFMSKSKSFRISYRSILGHDGNERQLRLMVQGKPEINLEFGNEFLYPIFKTSLAIANQTKMAKGSERSRHIRRDVRQTVWRRYGGRCAECKANDYLEFDHIIPVAKGGNNSEANVQLLCRKCNNRKSDKI